MAKQPDPYYDLILDEDVQKDQWPKKMDEIHKGERQSLMAQVMTKEVRKCRVSGKKVPLLIEFLLRIQFKEVFFTDTLYFIFFCVYT